MSYSTSAYRVLAIASALAAASCLPALARAQCAGTYELFIGPVPQAVNFAFVNPATGLIMAVEPQYGGATAGRTWSWNGTAWQRVIDQGPINVIPAMVAWDTARSRAVAVNQYGQTWEWNGTSWSQVGTCPSTRCTGAAVTYDAGRGVTILVTGGGVNGSPPAETWEWNGSVWTQRLVSGPANRHNALLVYDAARNVTVLYGGLLEPATIGAPAFLSDLWEFNGTTWTQRTTGSGPGPLAYACATYHAPSGGVLVYGGQAFTMSSQMWVWNGTAWSSLPTSGPGEQGNASLLHDPVAGKLTLFGRITPVNSNPFGKYGWQVFSRLDGQNWTTGIKSDDYYPAGGDRGVMAYDSDRGVTVRFGGMMPGGDLLSDSTTWEFNGQAWTRRSAFGPAGRTFAAMAYDPVRHRMVMTGGTTSNNNAVAETWEYDGSNWTLVSTDPAAGRRSHTTAFDPVRGMVIVQGGHITGGTRRFDTQGWNGTTWTPIAATAPTNLIPMAYDRRNQYIFGTAIDLEVNATLRLALSGWTQITPGAIDGLHPQWDDAIQSVIAYSNSARATYRWTGSAWAQIPVTVSPSNRGDFFAAAYDSRRDRYMVYGGYAGNTNNDLWQLMLPTADLGRPGGLPGPDGQLDNNDFIVFITHFFNSSPLADVGRQGGVHGADGALDNNDFIAFIDLFFAGCGV
ncbi:MAG: kelch repeat-containing protein [Phycisphaerales bacterium]